MSVHMEKIDWKVGHRRLQSKHRFSTVHSRQKRIRVAAHKYMHGRSCNQNVRSLRNILYLVSLVTKVLISS